MIVAGSSNAFCLHCEVRHASEQQLSIAISVAALFRTQAMSFVQCSQQQANLIKRQLGCRAFSLKYSKAASLSENLDFLREILQKLGHGHHVVIFVLDEFDLFARKAKQTTLYNLLDAVQTAGVQVSQ